MPANGTANLIPIQRGQNPRLILPNHRERGPSFETQLERIANMRGGEVDDGDGKVKLNLEAHAWYKLLRDSRNDKDFDLVQRANALAKFSDRLHGKPLQRNEVSIDHNVTGKTWDELSEEECDTIIAEPNRYIERDGRIFEAEFRDVSEGTSAEGEDTEGSDSSVKAAAGAAD